MSSTPSQGFGFNRNRVNAAFTLGLFTILGALAFEHIGGLYPCELCLEQRWPYYIGLPLMAIAIVGWRRLPVAIVLALVAGAAALFAWGTIVGVYHAGVEWDIFAGPQSCTGVGEAISFDALSNIEDARVVPCDEVQFAVLGVSLAGFNAIISAVITALLARTGFKLFKRARTA